MNSSQEHLGEGFKTMQMGFLKLTFDIWPINEIVNQTTFTGMNLWFIELVNWCNHTSVCLIHYMCLWLWTKHESHEPYRSTVKHFLATVKLEQSYDYKSRMVKNYNLQFYKDLFFHLITFSSSLPKDALCQTSGWKLASGYGEIF